MNILFWDAVCNKQYTIDTEKTESLGGTERTVLRVAQALSAQYGVYLYQHKADSREAETIGGITHIGLDSKFPTPDVVVHLRTAVLVPVLAAIYPDAKHLVWAHDLAVEADYVKEDYEQVSGIIAVSDFHKTQIETVLKATGISKPVYKIYNPVNTSGVLPRERFPKTAAFISSPHKGLSQSLALFSEARDAGLLDSIEIANPGYMHLDTQDGPGIVKLGDLTHRDTMEVLSKTGVLLYPQRVFPETFGHVYAEANALGVPVLAYDFGAAREVLCINNRPYKARSVSEWLDALKETMQLDIKTGVREQFCIENVSAVWDALLKKG